MRTSLKFKWKDEWHKPQYKFRSKAGNGEFFYTDHRLAWYDYQSFEEWKSQTGGGEDE